MTALRTTTKIIMTDLSGKQFGAAMTYDKGKHPEIVEFDDRAYIYAGCDQHGPWHYHETKVERVSMRHLAELVK